ncbi:hypothetical protein SAMN05421820_102193 [Pedobacter steynii]|uniref:Uncharacterized protein n=1 Tax=Pedobacter steynii TaxID=430522 RepID=A0A1G9N2G5_9SPHI|nr:hypothetical protein [Pedobacter steynii]NQX39431.1 hypothetical protein [Pedobacter steynii]SDL80574.1 hypothetical protein SAMN05421820_102193 [Pedobacter steynii]
MISKDSSLPKKIRIAGLCLVFLLSLLLLNTNTFANLWSVATGRGYLIPEESSIVGFRVTQMNEGSGEYWLYAEDEHHYYTVMEKSGTKPYLLLSKEKASSCPHFDKLDVKTWCK